MADADAGIVEEHRQNNYNNHIQMLSIYFLLLESHGSTKQSYTWEAFDITKIEENELLSGLSELLPPIMSEKRTPAHEEVILARDSVIEVRLSLLTCIKLLQTAHIT